MPKFKEGELVTPKVGKTGTKPDATTSITQGRVAIVVGIASEDSVPGQTIYKLKWPEPHLDAHAGIMFEKDLKHAAGNPNGRRRIPLGGEGDLIVEYSSNNSGGSWWLDDEDWEKLEQAGWQVDWYSDPEVSTGMFGRGGDTFLGAKATRARKRFSKMGEGIREWEDATNKDSSDVGCSCCGVPHSFSSENTITGENDYWYTERPSKGSRYDD
jgi:hypothetical protein